MRYGVIRTQKRAGHDVKGGPTHWLRRCTLVRIVRKQEGKFGCSVETMYPVFGVPISGTCPNRYGVREQLVARSDFYELPRWSGPVLEWFAPKFQRAREWLCLA